MDHVKVMPALVTIERTTERGNWCWMPNAILDYAERGIIDALAVAVYMALARHADVKGGCHPSVGRLARMLGLSRDTVRDRLHQLQDAQLIIIRRRWLKNHKPTSHWYILLEPLVLPPRDAVEDLTIYLVEGYDVNSDGIAYDDAVTPVFGGQIADPPDDMVADVEIGAVPSGDAVAGRKPAGDAVADDDPGASPSGDAVAGEGGANPQIADIKQAYADAIRRRRAANGRQDCPPSATKPTNTGDGIGKNKT